MAVFFSVGTVLAALSTNVTELIVFRFIASASFLVMAISGLVAGGLILFGVRAARRSLETATAE